MDDMRVMFVFIRVMIADESYVTVNESYHYKMALVLENKHNFYVIHFLSLTVHWKIAPTRCR